MIVYDYSSYMVTEPLNVDEGLRRVLDTDFDLCRALLILLFREDHFDNGSFETRVERGDVKLIVERMRDLIREELQYPRLAAFGLVCETRMFGNAVPNYPLIFHVTLSYIVLYRYSCKLEYHKKRAFTLLENHSIIQRIDGKYNQGSCKFAILPTILSAVSSEKLNAVISVLRKEEGEDEEAEEDSAG